MFDWESNPLFTSLNSIKQAHVKPVWCCNWIPKGRSLSFILCSERTISTQWWVLLSVPLLEGTENIRYPNISATLLQWSTTNVKTCRDRDSTVNLIFPLQRVRDIVQIFVTTLLQKLNKWRNLYQNIYLHCGYSFTVVVLEDLLYSTPWSRGAMA